MALTNEAIWAAADALVEAGAHPTLAAVRSQLGRGSYKTITDAMAQWRDRQAVAQTRQADPVPPLITERLVRVAAEAWSQAMDAAHARFDGERAMLEAEATRHETERQEAIGLADQLAADVDRLQASQRALEETHASALGELAQVQQDLAVAEARLGDLKQQLALAQEGERRAIAEAAELRGRLEVLGSETLALHARRASGKDGDATAALPE